MKMTTRKVTMLTVTAMTTTTAGRNFFYRGKERDDATLKNC